MTSEGETATVRVVVSEAERGVQKYTARVACDAADIESVEAGALQRYFEIVEGGEGASFVRARAVDMTGEAGEITDPTALFTIHFTEPVAPASVTLTFETILGHDGETIPDERLRFEAVA
ncbi:hypothetical protein EGH24_09905 [Halonotius terrestris]|uniref:Uncharacterized protein n=1 Tax=Halonotius terrestris TaxID=2487750 RepID=A0A8J8P8P6_9EURY|nr:hypothetical protein [Halonotius terrestris]TQQ79799.1 hypothetical protein EGH24_09905 [Halonotius terrestris]